MNHDDILKSLVLKLAEMPYDLTTKLKRIGSGRMAELTVVVAGKLGILKNFGICLLPMGDAKGSVRANQLNGDVCWILQNQEYDVAFIDVKATNRVSEDSLNNLKDGHYFFFNAYTVDPGHEYFIVKKNSNFVEWVKNTCEFEVMSNEMTGKEYKMYSVDYRDFCLAMDKNGMEQLRDIFCDKGPSAYTAFLRKINVMLEEIRPTYEYYIDADGKKHRSVIEDNLRYRVPLLSDKKLHARKFKREQKNASS